MLDGADEGFGGAGSIGGQFHPKVQAALGRVPTAAGRQVTFGGRQGGIAAAAQLQAIALELLGEDATFQQQVDGALVQSRSGDIRRLLTRTRRS